MSHDADYLEAALGGLPWISQVPAAEILTWDASLRRGSQHASDEYAFLKWHRMGTTNQPFQQP
jgi:hypothetical protein